MDDHLLLWLSLPLVLPVILADGEGRGTAVARLLIAAFGLAAVFRGAGTLAPAAVRAHALTSSEAALFTAVTVGIVIGGLALWQVTSRWSLLASLPLLTGMLWAGAGTGRPGALLLGAVLGAAPILAGRMVPHRRNISAGGGADARPAAMVLLGMATLLLAAGGPVGLFLVATIAAGVLAGDRDSQAGWLRRLLIAGLALLPVWLTLTIPDTPWIGLDSYLAEAPVPDAAARLLGAAGSLLIVALLLPLPGCRVHPGVAAASASLLAMALTARITAPGMLVWQPVLTAVLVLTAVVASWRGSRSTVVGVLAVLAALRPGMLSALTSAALAMTLLVPTGRVSLRVAPVLVGAVAVASAFTVALVLGDEILLACVLVAGLASAASRPSAPAEPPLTERGT